MPLSQQASLSLSRLFQAELQGSATPGRTASSLSFAASHWGPVLTSRRCSEAVRPELKLHPQAKLNLPLIVERRRRDDSGRRRQSGSKADQLIAWQIKIRMVLYVKNLGSKSQAPSLTE